MAEQSLPKGYGAIGSERKTTRPQSGQPPVQGSSHARRPSSWQDEVGNTTPNIPKQIGNLEPFDIERGPRSPQRYIRSTSFPESNSPQPNLRLTQVRSHGNPVYEKTFAPRSKDLGATGLIPLSTQEEEFTSPGAEPDASFHSPAQSPVNQTFARSPQQALASSSEQDTFAHAMDSLHLREGGMLRGIASSSRMPFPSHRSPISAPQREDLTLTRGFATPSPATSATEIDMDMYRRAPVPQRRPGSSRADSMSSSQPIQEHMIRRGPSLLHLPMPQTAEQLRQAQLTEGELMCLRLRDEVRMHIPDSDYPFLNGGPPNFNINDYPAHVQRAVMNLHQSGGNTKPGADPPASGATPRQDNVYMVVTFKLHRAAIYYRPEDMIFASEIKNGDMIVVQADRGEDVGFVWSVTSNVLEAEETARQLNFDHLRNLLSFVKLFTTAANRLSRAYVQPSHGQDLVFKSIIRKAGGPEGQRLMDKEHDETKAKRIAEQKAQERGLPMEILDAEFQADHGKLTIYYISEQYIVFKEFVDDMYKVYKMRVWMSSVNQVRPSR